MPPRADPQRERAPALGVFTTTAQPWDGRNMDPDSWAILLDNDITIGDVPPDKQVPFVGHTLYGPALQLSKVKYLHLFLSTEDPKWFGRLIRLL